MNAFPSEKNSIKTNQGMDLRDYFAAKVMQGFIIQTEYGSNMNIDSYCKKSYQVADKMMKARGE